MVQWAQYNRPVLPMQLNLMLSIDRLDSNIVQKLYAKTDGDYTEPGMAWNGK
jgi:hypothetical protein